MLGLKSYLRALSLNEDAIIKKLLLCVESGDD